MIRSMTGFARVEQHLEAGQLVWELRTVNHRYLDIHFRLPEEFRSQEAVYRERIQTALGRGKLDASLRWTPAPGSGQHLRLNSARAGELMTLARELGGLEGAGELRPLGQADVLRYPGVVEEEAPDLAPVLAAALELLDQGLAELSAARAAEGARIDEMLRTRSTAVLREVDSVAARLPGVMQGVRDKLLARLDKLDIEADPARLEQELAIIAQRLDVAEELDRLKAHVEALDEALAADKPVGRRLDFLMQEFNREANTLGSKAQDTDTTRAAMELKVLIEQMREQVQNVE